MKFVKRGAFYSMQRRVPKRFQSIEPRAAIWVSLKTGCPKEAESRAPKIWEEMIEGWEAELAGHTDLAEKRFTAAKNFADRLGKRWLPSDEVAALPLDDILQRVEASAGPKGRPTRARGDALLGGAKKPVVTTDKILDMFWLRKADELRGKTQDQIRRYKNPRLKAFKLFHAVNRVLEVPSITRADMLAFRDYLMERINSGDITAASANKDLLYFCGPVKFVNKMEDWQLDLPFSDLSFKEGRAKQRPPYSTAFIRGQILGKGRLDGLNDEARRIVRIMINTGARPSEIAGTKLSHFDLDRDIPLMKILPEDRQLKNDHSLRSIPLVGVSLDAAREAVASADRAGRELVFPRYFGKDKLSDAVNKFFRENGLKETPDTTLYSLRHSFEDRLLLANVADRVRSDLFGHDYQRERYGTGGGDELRHQALLKIAL